MSNPTNMTMPENIVGDVSMPIPYDALRSAIPLGVDNAIGLKELRIKLKDFDVTKLKECLEICKRYGAPIEERDGKYFRIKSAKEYGDMIQREDLKRKLGIENHILYR